MSEREFMRTVLATLVILVLVFVGVSLFIVLRPRPLPRILDEHGNNIVYTCPGDRRCPTPVTQ